MKRDPWIDRLIGYALMRRGIWLLKHGNSHEGRHYYAALVAGDSTTCGAGQNCWLDKRVPVEFCLAQVPYRNTTHGCVEFAGHTGPHR